MTLLFVSIKKTKHLTKTFFFNLFANILDLNNTLKEKKIF